jgi:hypothetical protein
MKLDRNAVLDLVRKAKPGEITLVNINALTNDKDKALSELKRLITARKNYCVLVLET